MFFTHEFICNFVRAKIFDQEQILHVLCVEYDEIYVCSPPRLVAANYREQEFRPHYITGL